MDAPGSMLGKHLGAKMPVDIFICALTILGWKPSQNILLFTMDRVNISDSLNSLVIKNVSYKIYIPGTSVRNPQLRNCSRQR